MDRWQLLKDILLTGTGVGLIVWEAHLPSPSEALLGVALVLLAPSAYQHVKVLLPGRGDGESSESSSPPSSSRSGRHSGEAG